MKGLIFSVIATLSGCVTTAGLTEELQSYIGQPAQSVVQRIGYPDDQREILGDTVLSWSVSRHTTLYLPSTQTTTGNVDGASFSATTASEEALPLHFQCTIRIAIDQAQVIKHVQWRGNRGGCSRYARALSR